MKFRLIEKEGKWGMLKKRVEMILRAIEDQVSKRQFLNALCWTNDLQKELLLCLSDVLKGKELPTEKLEDDLRLF